MESYRKEIKEYDKEGNLIKEKVKQTVLEIDNDGNVVYKKDSLNCL